MDIYDPTNTLPPKLHDIHSKTANSQVPPGKSDNFRGELGNFHVFSRFRLYRRRIWWVLQFCHENTPFWHTFGFLTWTWTENYLTPTRVNEPDFEPWHRLAQIKHYGYRAPTWVRNQSWSASIGGPFPRTPRPCTLLHQVLNVKYLVHPPTEFACQHHLVWGKVPQSRCYQSIYGRM